MEIRVRTYDEVSSERVTIGIEPGQRIEIELADTATSADGTLERTLEESRELVQFKDKVIDEIEAEAERLRAKVIELTNERNRLRGERRDAINGKDLALGSLAEVRLNRDELKRKVELYDYDRTTERNRADRLNKERLDLVAELKMAHATIRETGDRHQRQVAEVRKTHPETMALTDRLVDILFSEKVGRAMLSGPNFAPDLREAVDLARQVLVPYVHRRRTSQA